VVVDFWGTRFCASSGWIFGWFSHRSGCCWFGWFGFGLFSLDGLVGLVGLVRLVVDFGGIHFCASSGWIVGWLLHWFGCFVGLVVLGTLTGWFGWFGWFWLV
jgi:hypothetical protein